MLVTEIFEAEKQWLPHVVDGKEKNCILPFFGSLEKKTQLL